MSEFEQNKSVLRLSTECSLDISLNQMRNGKEVRLSKLSLILVDPSISSFELEEEK